MHSCQWYHKLEDTDELYDMSFFILSNLTVFRPEKIRVIILEISHPVLE